mgnify:CR=1 FL=1
MTKNAVLENTKPFKQQFPFTKRLNEANRVLEKYPDRIPIIVEQDTRSSGDLPRIDKKKFLVPNDLTVGQFVYVIRKRIHLSPEKAIFVMVDKILPQTSILISELYKNHKHEDNFLYLTYTSENTFG